MAYALWRFWRKESDGGGDENGGFVGCEIRIPDNFQTQINDVRLLFIMPCGFTDMEVHILYILYRFKNFKSDAGYHSEKLKKILRKKYSQDFDMAISHLKNEGLISTVKKTEPKFYILDIGLAYSVLKEHGYNVTSIGGGRFHHLD